MLEIFWEQVYRLTRMLQYLQNSVSNNFKVNINEPQYKHWLARIVDLENHT